MVGAPGGPRTCDSPTRPPHAIDVLEFRLGAGERRASGQDDHSA
jgi:hypothetical protein